MDCDARRSSTALVVQACSKDVSCHICHSEAVLGAAALGGCAFLAPGQPEVSDECCLREASCALSSFVWNTSADTKIQTVLRHEPTTGTTPEQRAPRALRGASQVRPGPDGSADVVLNEFRVLSTTQL